MAVPPKTFIRLSLGHKKSYILKSRPTGSNRSRVHLSRGSDRAAGRVSTRTV